MTAAFVLAKGLLRSNAAAWRSLLRVFSKGYLQSQTGCAIIRCIFSGLLDERRGIVNFCGKCGTLLVVNARFCTNCGEAVTTQTPSSNVPTAASADPNPSPRPHSPFSSAPEGGAPPTAASGGTNAAYGAYGSDRSPYWPNGFQPNGSTPFPYAPPRERPHHQGQLVFAIINIVLGFFSGTLMALLGLWPLNHVLKARQALTDAEARERLAAAKRANIGVLSILLLTPVLLYTVALLLVIGSFF